MVGPFKIPGLSGQLDRPYTLRHSGSTEPVAPLVGLFKMPSLSGQLDRPYTLRHSGSTEPWSCQGQPSGGVVGLFKMRGQSGQLDRGYLTGTTGHNLMKSCLTFRQSSRLDIVWTVGQVTCTLFPSCRRFRPYSSPPSRTSQNSTLHLAHGLRIFSTLCLAPALILRLSRTHPCTHPPAPSAFPHAHHPSPSLTISHHPSPTPCHHLVATFLLNV